MKPDTFKIYNKNKYVGILPGKRIDKTEFCEEHILLSRTYNIKPGYIIVVNDCEKFYVTDVRLHDTSSGYKLQLFYESEGEYTKRNKEHCHQWKIAIFNTIGGAVAGLITSILFWLITK